VLGTNRDEFPRLDSAEGFQDRRHERPELLHTIRSRDYQDDTDTRGPQILLERQALIDGQETFESRGDHQLQKFTVSLR
jgi:hypothetical protein